jgi:hypothetical protein
MDPNNPVVKLCAQGMQAEFKGEMEEARDLFMRAWDAQTDDFEACIAAHYVARHQESPQEMLRWNQFALAHAQAGENEEIRGFYPSLYLNLGYCWETLDDREQAIHFYKMAEERVKDVAEGDYGAVIREGIKNGLMRTEYKER